MVLDEQQKRMINKAVEFIATAIRQLGVAGEIALSMADTSTSGFLDSYIDVLRETIRSLKSYMQEQEQQRLETMQEMAEMQTEEEAEEEAEEIEEFESTDMRAS